MEFKYRASDPQASRSADPLGGKETLIRPRLPHYHEDTKNTDLIKQQIRAEIIAREFLYRRQLEIEVRRELAIENELILLKGLTNGCSYPYTENPICYCQGSNTMGMPLSQSHSSLATGDLGILPFGDHPETISIASRALMKLNYGDYPGTLSLSSGAKLKLHCNSPPESTSLAAAAMGKLPCAETKRRIFFPPQSSLPAMPPKKLPTMEHPHGDPPETEGKISFPSSSLAVEPSPKLSSSENPEHDSNNLLEIKGSDPVATSPIPLNALSSQKLASIEHPDVPMAVKNLNKPLIPCSAPNAASCDASVVMNLDEQASAVVGAEKGKKDFSCDICKAPNAAICDASVVMNLDEPASAAVGAEKGKKDFSCDICNVSLNSESVFLTHIRGKKHKANEARVIQSCSGDIATQPPFVKHVDEQGRQSTCDEPGRKKRKVEFWCKYCDVRCPSEEVMTSHNLGRKHKAMLKYQAFISTNGAIAEQATSTTSSANAS